MTISVRAVDAGGRPLGNVKVVVAASGSGNSLMQQGMATDGEGVLTATLRSIVAETKTISSRAADVELAQKPTVEFVAPACPSGYLPDACTDCAPGYHHAAAAPQTCVEDCPVGYLPDACTDCVAGYHHAAAAPQTCVADCPAGYAPDACTDCAPGYHHAAADPATCVADCAVGYLPDACSDCAPGYHHPPSSPTSCVHACADGDPCAARCASSTLLEIPEGPCTPTHEPPYFDCGAATATDCASDGRLCGGKPAACWLLAEPASGDLIFTEFMNKPVVVGDTKTTWVEFRNVADHALNLAPLALRCGPSVWRLGQPEGPAIPLAPGAYFVAGSSTDLAQNGGAHVDLASPAFAPLTSLVSLGYCPLGGSWRSVADLLTYFPDDTRYPPGHAIALSSSMMVGEAYRNPGYWCSSQAPLSPGFFGTPGEDSDVDCEVQTPATFPSGTTCQVFAPVQLAVPACGSSASLRARIPAVTTVSAGSDYYPHLEVELGSGTGDNALDWPSEGWIRADPSDTGFYGTDLGDRFSAKLVPPWPWNPALRYGFRMRLLDPADGSPTPWAYCDGVGLVTGDPPVTAAWAAGRQVTTTSQIEGFRSDDTSSGCNDFGCWSWGPEALAGVVTYARASLGGLALVVVQGEAGGSAVALFQNLAAFSGLVPPLAVGDRLEMMVTDKDGGPDGLLVVHGVRDVVRCARGERVDALVEDISASSDLVQRITSHMDNPSSRLVRLSGTLSGSAIPSAGYYAYRFTSLGYPAPRPDVQLRIAPAVLETTDLGDGCAFTLEATPLWWRSGSSGTVVQPSAWVPGELAVVPGTCPAPRPTRALATGPSTVLLAFDRHIAPSSVAPSTFHIDGGLAFVDGTVSGRRLTLTTSGPMAAGASYVVTVPESVADVDGRTLDVAAPRTLALNGYRTPAVLRISELNPYITDQRALLELEVVTPGNTAGIQLLQQLLVPRVVAELPDLELGAGERVVLHLNPPALGTPIFTETTTTADCTAAGSFADARCYATAWDVVAAPVLGIGDSVLALRAADGTLQDVVALNFEGGEFLESDGFCDDLKLAQSLGLWAPDLPSFSGPRGCGVTATYGVAVSVHTVGANGSKSAYRKAGATDRYANAWTIGASTWGRANP